MSDVIYNISSGFFDSVNGDRLYSAGDMNKPYKRVIADGIFPTPQGTPSTDFQVVAVSGMSVAVLAGNAMIGARWAENTDDVGITIAGNSSSSPRIDSIFLHIDTGMDTRAAGVVYRQGTAAGTPTAPAMVQTDNITELRLADILVAPSAAIITQANITDQRGGSDCPWVAGLIQQVDTSALFDQYRAAYAEQQQDQANEWNTFMDHLARDYDISMSLRKHESTYTSTAAASLIPINIDGYDTTKDLLQVYINGIFAVEGTHYIVKSATQIQLTNAISAGQKVHFVIYKAVMGGAQPIIPTDEQVQDAVDAYMDAHPGALVVDPELSDTSTHAIQNKAVTEALAGVNGRLGGQKIGTEFEWEIGSLTPGRGTVTTSATRIRSKFIPVTNGTHITLSAPTNRLLVYCYDANKLYVSDSPWLEYNEYTIDNVNVAYVRILIRKGTSNTTIVDSEVEGLASGLAISYSVPFEVYTELRSVVTDTEKLNSRLDELDSFSREWSVETKTVSVSVTVGHEVGGSTQHLIDVNIPAGKEFTFIINGESGILTKYALYANGSQINSSCDFGTKYTFTASADITYIGIYATASWATSTGTVNAVLEVLTYNENSLEVQKADKAELVGYVSKELMQKCKIVHQEASPNKWNPETAVNGMVHTDGRLLTGGTYDNYCHESIGHVNEGDVITGYLLASPYGVIQRIAAYNANGNVVSSAGATEVRTYTVPAGVASLTITVSDIRSESCMILVNADEAPTEFMPYAEEADFYVATEGFWELVKPTMNLPKKIYAVVGFELNIYFENIVEDWTKYDWNVDCTVGKQMERGYQIAPTASDVGTKTLTITATDEHGNVNTVIASLVITAANAGSGQSKSVIVLGDSTTNNGTVIEKLNANFASDAMNVTTLGTRGTAPNNHEGRSGWKLNDYFTKEYIDYTDDRGHVANPFYNPSTQTFDAAYYFANSGIAVPDFFIINMGVNDVFSFTSDTALNAGIDQFISYVDAAITSIKEAAPNTKICICCTIPPNHSQDAFGKAYACGQTRNRCKRNNTLLVDRIIEEYDGRESENIYMIPIHTNLDTVYNMGMETLPVNARNTDITYQSPILNGGVHPVTSGYWQIADVYTAFIKAHA